MFIEINEDIVTGLFKRKIKLNNQHLLVAVFCGHFEYWLKDQMNNKYSKPKCPKCDKKYDRSDFFTADGCHTLGIPGSVPMSLPELYEHIEFLEYVNRLCDHLMFETWNKETKVFTDV